jgi:hypothetical protein
MAIYLGLVVLVFLGQRKFIYHPYRPARELSNQAAASHGFQAWENDQHQFIGWKKVAKTQRDHAQILIVHGNAGCAINRLDYAEEMQGLEPMDIYILEYPGFGQREGTPTQASLFQAATEAFGLLSKTGPVYVLGESLGTGVAAYLAGTFPQNIAGVFLIAPYNNLTDVAQRQMPMFPVRWLLKDRFPSDTFLQAYPGPIGVLLAGNDDVVPNQFGRKLFDGYQGPKKVWEIADAGHNDLVSQSGSVWKELFAFWNQNPIRTKP